MKPSQLNDVFRLVIIAERCGAEVLDNGEGFDRVTRRGRFSELKSNVLDVARRIVKSPAHRPQRREYPPKQRVAKRG